MLAGDNILTALSVARECRMVQPRDRVVLVSAALAPDACVAVAAPAAGDGDAAAAAEQVLVRQRWRERNFSERDDSMSHLRPLFGASSSSIAKRTAPTQLSFRSEEGIQLELYVDPTWVCSLPVHVLVLVLCTLTLTPDLLLLLPPECSTIDMYGRVRVQYCQLAAALEPQALVARGWRAVGWDTHGAVCGRRCRCRGGG